MEETEDLYGEDITDAPAPLEDLNRENTDVGAGKQSCSKPDGDDDDDDDDIMDPDYQPGKNGECQSSVDSDSDSQVTSSHVPMKRKRQSVERTEWTADEIGAIENHLLPAVKRLRKPPKKSEIIKMQTITEINSLKHRKWQSIKFRCWAIFQKENKK